MKRNKKKDAHWGPSLFHFPWNQKEKLSQLEEVLDDTLVSWYREKHREPSIKEIELINSLEKTKCPYCGSISIRKCGFYGKGIQRYQCKVCYKKFSPLTNTIFDSKKIPISEWIEYLLHLFEFHSIRSSARDNRNAESTGRYWLIKVFEVLKNCQKDIILEGNIYLDEMYFSVVPSKEISKNGQKLHGISRNKIGVTVAFDNHDHYYFYVTYVSKPSDKSTWNAIGSHIKPKSHLIHDGERLHGILIRRLELTEEYYKTDVTKKMKDEKHPLYPINHIHALAKRFMREHGSFNRDDLQDWMNLFWFIISKPNNRYEKVGKFLEMAINSSCLVRYREVM